jgi:Protein of unknown function (DUF1194)
MAQTRTRFAVATLGLLAACGLLVAKPLSLPAAETEVDVALVLAIDCSYSVDSSEHQLQMDGFGAALQSPEVLRAILSGQHQRIAIIAYQWSDIDTQRVIIPWTIIDSKQSADAVAAELFKGRRSVAQGGTGISSALMFGYTLFANAPHATRQVIDLATDGRNNMGSPTPQARDAIVAQGVTINGLAITNEWPTLDRYLENQVAGGDENFVEKAGSYDDFGSAMLRKLVKEITGPGMT